jgi:hypothetical protein
LRVLLAACFVSHIFYLRPLERRDGAEAHHEPATRAMPALLRPRLRIITAAPAELAPQLGAAPEARLQRRQPQADQSGKKPCRWLQNAADSNEQTSSDHKSFGKAQLPVPLPGIEPQGAKASAIPIARALGRKRLAPGRT